MSKYYRSQRVRNLFAPDCAKPFKLSRSKLDLFLECPRCFYFDRRLGVARPPGYPFTLNSAVDRLLKTEFDQYRKLRQPHPLMVNFGIDAIPFDHELLDYWRNSLHGGIQFHHLSTNLIIHGGIDDLWIRRDKKLVIVDYKAKSKAGEVTLDADWQIAYKRQMEIYGWLFKQNGFDIHGTSYFVYCNGRSDLNCFDRKLQFDVTILPYNLNDSWVEPTIIEARKCLDDDSAPPVGSGCDYCDFNSAISLKQRGVMAKS